MPKHKRDKHAKTTHQTSGQAGRPPAVGSEQPGASDNKTFQQHDPNNRIGGYEGRGNHARTGNRGHQ